MSGTGETDADSSKVLRPTMVAGAGALLHDAAIGTSVGSKAPVGVMAKTKDCAMCAVISTALLGKPVR